MSRGSIDFVQLASKRSDYVANLRRAFLLRVHPDRFRSHSENIKKIQAEAIQNVTDRLSSADFAVYKSPDAGGHHDAVLYNWKKQRFHLEQKDGSVKQYTVNLNDNAEDVLRDISSALKSTGMSVPQPPSMQKFDTEFNEKDFHSSKSIEQYRMNSILRSANAHASNQVNINEIFNVNTRQGRDLLRFLKKLDHDEIEQRKAHRIDASTSALIARQLFKFQSIDGTGLGWSSASLTKYLKSLARLYDEHKSKFKVESFYAFQLVLSNDEFRDKIDLFGGSIMLNPGFSDEQNLKTLFAIDQDSIDQLEKNRDFLMQNQMVVQNILNIKVKKGYSCSSKEYHEFLCHFANYLSSLTINQEESTSQALALQRIQLVIETAYVCRRPIVTNVGEIRISTCVKFDNVITSIRAKKLEAINKVADEQVKLRKAKELKDIVQYQLMSRIRKGRTGVTTDQFIESLTAFLELPEEKILPIRDLVQGQNIQIMGAGRSCQIGDDGSLLIPHDWR